MKKQYTVPTFKKKIICCSNNKIPKKQNFFGDKENNLMHYSSKNSNKKISKISEFSLDRSNTLKAFTKKKIGACKASISVDKRYHNRAINNHNANVDKNYSSNFSVFKKKGLHSDIRSFSKNKLERVKDESYGNINLKKNKWNYDKLNTEFFINFPDNSLDIINNLSEKRYIKKKPLSRKSVRDSIKNEILMNDSSNNSCLTNINSYNYVPKLSTFNKTNNIALSISINKSFNNNINLNINHIDEEPEYYNEDNDIDEEIFQYLLQTLQSLSSLNNNINSIRSEINNDNSNTENNSENTKDDNNDDSSNNNKNSIINYNDIFNKENSIKQSYLKLSPKLLHITTKAPNSVLEIYKNIIKIYDFNNNKLYTNIYSFFGIVKIALSLVFCLLQNTNKLRLYIINISGIVETIERILLIFTNDIIIKWENNEKFKINNNKHIQQLKHLLSQKNISIIQSSYKHIKILSKNIFNVFNDTLISLNVLNENNIKPNTKEEFLYKNFCQKDFEHLLKIDILHISKMLDKNIFKNIKKLRSNYANIISLTNSIKNINEQNSHLESDKEKLPKEIYDPSSKIIKFEIEIKDTPIELKEVTEPFLNFKPNKEYTLILDLDETLVNFKFFNESTTKGILSLRPHLDSFLSFLSEFYEIIAFTSASKDYADIALDIIDKKGKYFTSRLYREHTTIINKKYVKSLDKIGRSITRLVIVDNLEHCFRYNKENGIVIKGFYGNDENDTTLIELQKILIKIYNDKDDVRKSIKKYEKEIKEKIS